MKMKFYKSLALLCIIGTVVSQATLSAQNKELKVLFVGNSYTYGNNLSHIVSIISEGTQTKLVTRKSVAGGAYMWEHWKGSRGLKTRELIASGEFDIVILQDYSMSAINTPDSTYKYIELFTAFNSEHGAETYLFNTWARKKVPQFQAEIDDVYLRAALANNITRVPVGPAWELAQDLRPSVELFTSDGSHPNSVGTLLTACVFVKTITGELPERLPTSFIIKDGEGETVRLMQLDNLDGEFCLRVTSQVCDSL